VRRWLVILIACQPGNTGDDDGDDTPPADTDPDPDTDTDINPGTSDTWVVDTGETGVTPECPDLAGAKVCGPEKVVTLPAAAGGDSGDSGDSGGSGGGGSDTTRCVSVAVEFNPVGVAKIQEADDYCAMTTTYTDWACIGPNLVELDGLTTGNWIPRDGLTGAIFTSPIWPPLSEDMCAPEP
jgi:hypothetical protein